MWMHTASCLCLIILDTEAIKRHPCQVGVLNTEDVSALFLSPLETFVFPPSLPSSALYTYNRILQLKANAISNTLNTMHYVNETTRMEENKGCTTVEFLTDWYL